jgi:hypothetical protein
MLMRMTWREPALLAGALLISYAYFYQAGGWNQNSRFDLVRSIVEYGTVRIDAFADNTGDKTLVDGHSYSDKAPGQALSALPLAGLWTVVAHAAGIDVRGDTETALLAYAATVWAAGLPTVVAALCIAWSARRLGSSSAGAGLTAVAFGLASPAWAYATLFWGHALAAGCLAMGFAAALALSHAQGDRQAAWLALLVGATCGWAVVTEYPAAPAAAIVAALAVLHALPYGRPRALRVAAGVLSAGAAALLVLGAYNLAAFGSPLRLSYEGVQGFEGMSEGVFGVTLPKRTVLQEILFGQFRGLVPLAPALAFAPVGLVLAGRQPANRAAVVAAASIAVYYLLFNASYYYWSGGFSYGPRHVGAALPFMFLGLGQVWTSGGRVIRSVLALLTAYGASLSIMAVSTIVMLPEDSPSPLTELVLPAFLRGQLALNRQSFLQYGTAHPAEGVLGAWNLGQLVGLRGQASLIPLGLLWLVVAVVLVRIRTAQVGCTRSK